MNKSALSLRASFTGNSLHEARNKRERDLVVVSGSLRGPRLVVESEVKRYLTWRVAKCSKVK